MKKKSRIIYILKIGKRFSPLLSFMQILSGNLFSIFKMKMINDHVPVTILLWYHEFFLSHKFFTPASRGRFLNFDELFKQSKRLIWFIFRISVVPWFLIWIPNFKIWIQTESMESIFVDIKGVSKSYLLKQQNFSKPAKC